MLSIIAMAISAIAIAVSLWTIRMIARMSGELHAMERQLDHEEAVAKRSWP